MQQNYYAFFCRYNEQKFVQAKTLPLDMTFTTVCLSMQAAYLCKNMRMLAVLANLFT